MTSIETISGAEMGHLLNGFGVNLLVSNTERTAQFLEGVLGFTRLRLSVDYAVLKHRENLYQLHVDATYNDHPLLSVLPENGIRGAGIELRLFQVDPDEAERKALEGDYHVLQSTADKPHGLRECFLLDPDGYCWVPSLKI
ncbi:MAG: glyoxalase [Gammaproteobacteria bacterium]|nr:glyoxalase [Gammaproteobacteria bacterium]